ncbi:hypothetical protein [Bergeyella sp. RCAD1439]|uniref:hypothetical protein n=1 Tax=Bergeyella anatis TaxID=3113737 RepID=UPI002E19F445|nr:hypothetical protein [Bergeyella sp. RCAD1439]
MKIDWIRRLGDRTVFPLGTMIWAVVVWVALAALVYWINTFVAFTGNNILFPFSVIYPSAFLWSGPLFGVAFLALGLWAFKWYGRWNFYVLFAVALLLVFLGNMGQGNIDEALLKPFYYKGRQYYADAVQITDWRLWLKEFNGRLDEFQLHTRTHPPYITLLHYFFLWVFDGSILGLGLTFLALSAFSFPLVNGVMKNFSIPTERRKLLLLLFAVIPSVNIYLMVSIDALVLTSSLLVFYGVSRVSAARRMDWVSLSCMVSGLLLTNLMTFSGLFLFAFLGLFSLVQCWYRRYEVLWASVISGVGCLLGLVLVSYGTGSNWLTTFFEASHSENPNGFMLFYSPRIYFFTRLEDICEILFFLSFPFVSYLFSPVRYGRLYSDSAVNGFSFSAFAVLLLMFLTGAYGTGETARACLYIVPFFLLFLKQLKQSSLEVLFGWCLLQTFAMQLIGNYYW